MSADADGKFEQIAHRPSVAEEPAQSRLLSNGAKAARLAAEHVSRIEEERDLAQDEVRRMKGELIDRDARLDEINKLLSTVTSERNSFLLQATSAAAAINAAASALIEARKRVDPDALNAAAAAVVGEND
jgi:hypothetical protein